jgi:hypothetical protein
MLKNEINGKTCIDIKPLPYQHFTKMSSGYEFTGRNVVKTYEPSYASPGYVTQTILGGNYSMKVPRDAVEYMKLFDVQNHIEQRVGSARPGRIMPERSEWH